MSKTPVLGNCQYVHCTNGPDGKAAPIPPHVGRRRCRKYCCKRCGQMQNKIEARERKREKRMKFHPHKAVRRCLYCGKDFMSLDYGYRKCPDCKEHEAE